MDTATESSRVRLSKTLSGLAVAGFLTYVAVTVAFLGLRRDLDPLRRVMSNYAVGQRGYLMDVAFLAFGSGALAFALALVRVDPAGRRARAGAALLSVASVGLFLAAVFPTDVNAEDIAVTTTGAIHVTAGIVTFLSLTAACVVISSLAWPRRADAILASIVLLVAFALVVASLALELRGLGQRLFLYTALIWLVVATYRLGWRRGRG